MSNEDGLNEEALNEELFNGFNFFDAKTEDVYVFLEKIALITKRNGIAIEVKISGLSFTFIPQLPI